ncbi:DsrE family protein [Shewanella gelidimarina]|uniref:DsrE family protein n=1 Tax=Shewanella gelidimarina TaxID=56813 RepID=UPI00201017CB|nr:DsrE family protein [Shewanella gelidimarina]MCL1059914.1 DsrE family protein [Shewanella gelidimarina]
MKIQQSVYFLTGFILLCSFNLMAGSDAFKAGPVLTQYGKIAKVESRLMIPKNILMKVVFDMSKAAEPGKVNRSLDTLARFINMHVSEGVPLKNIELMMVVHGGAVADFTDDKFYQSDQLKPNGNTELISKLSKLGVHFYICGQSAAYYDVSPAQLLPGVDMALSAMTAHAIAANQGYSLNPF